MIAELTIVWALSHRVFTDTFPSMEQCVAEAKIVVANDFLGNNKDGDVTATCTPNDGDGPIVMNKKSWQPSELSDLMKLDQERHKFFAKKPNF